MKCFSHSEVDAVGVCKNCSKGICHQCLTVVENGIACSGLCTEKVTEINRLIDGNIKSKKTNVGPYMRNGILYGLMGLVFIIYGTVVNTNLQFIAIMGILFLIGAIFSFINAKNQKNS